MAKLSFHGTAFRSALRVLFENLVICCLAVSSCASAQVYYTPEEVRVSGLPTLMARTHDPSNVLRTSLDTIIHDRSVCCGKDSALEDSAERADPASLKDVATRLQGRHLLSDGRPIMINADYVEPTAINSGMLIGSLQAKQALLMQWNGRLYVCYGVTYRKDYDASTYTEVDTILKFLLLDTRYSDSRREVVFDRATDDWSRVQGMLRIRVEGP
jgi:hypothetical protein